MPRSVLTAPDVALPALGSRLLAAAAALCAGLLLVFCAGFAHSDVLHNAAHDSRHSAAFPCH